MPTPLEALDEIARLLEHALANPYKARAFRKAATAIAGLDDDAIASRLVDGSLRKVPGIGERSYQVILEAAAGTVPRYLADLREQAGVPAGGVLRAALRGDLHSHTDWSDGTTPLAAMAKAAQALGHEYLAITDHSPSLRVANGLSAERLEAQLELIDVSTDAYGVRLLAGIEVDILADGSLDQTPELLGRLDVVVGSVHSKLRMDGAEMTKRMLRAIQSGRMHVLGHCTGRLVGGSRGTRPQSEFDAERVFAACASAGVAVEINSRPERQDPPDDVLALAVAAGCLFSIDSDAHAPGHLAFLDLGAARAEAAGIEAERIVTTWPVERLLEWTGEAR
ncbi:MAG TPA: PHP domain-containing protein [Candidatus Lumbricidophila sp.]|nr:PHP domain-containing protein [Candidatus Lumbricidophila sp.]